MRYIAAYLLLQMGGTLEPTAEDIKRVLTAVGANVDEKRLKAFLSQITNCGKSMDELRSEGLKHLISISGSASQRPAQPVNADVGAEDDDSSTGSEVCQQCSDDEEGGIFDLFGD